MSAAPQYNLSLTREETWLMIFSQVPVAQELLDAFDHCVKIEGIAAAAAVVERAQHDNALGTMLRYYRTQLDVAQSAKPSTILDRIQEVVADEFEMDAKLLRGTSRMQDIVRARYVCLYIVRFLRPKMPLLRIGRLAGLHHSTILHAFARMRVWLDNEHFNERVMRVRAKLEIEIGVTNDRN